jgi:hypothetical protein
MNIVIASLSQGELRSKQADILPGAGITRAWQGVPAKGDA